MVARKKPDLPCAAGMAKSKVFDHALAVQFVAEGEHRESVHQAADPAETEPSEFSGAIVLVNGTLRASGCRSGGSSAGSLR